MKQKKTQKKYVSYHREDNTIKVRLFTGSVMVDEQWFRIGRDDERLCEWIFDKLGADFNAYQKNRNLSWQ